MVKAPIVYTITLRLWLFSMPMATIGVPIYEVYCFCLQETTVWFFGPAQACSAQQTPDRPACCATEKASCSLVKEQKQPCCALKAKKAQTHQCSKTTLKVHQLKAKYVVEGIDALALYWIAPEALRLPGFYTPVWIRQDQPLPAPPQPPPPRSGRDICVQHQLFLC